MFTMVSGLRLSVAFILVFFARAHDEDTLVRMAADVSLREAFKIRYDPDTKQAKIIPEEKTVEFDALPPEARAQPSTRRSKRWNKPQARFETINSTTHCMRSRVSADKK